MSHVIPVRGSPQGLPGWQVALFTAGTGLSVANVYYAQPLLDTLGTTYGLRSASLGTVIFATQLGCLLALLFVVPLGDRLNRRWLMRWQLLALIASLLLVAVAPSATMLMLAMLLTGLTGTAMTQGMIAFAAAAAPEETRGQTVGAVSAGVVVGLLLARVFAGAVSDIAGWRSVYLSSALMMTLLASVLWRRLPDIPRQISDGGPAPLVALWRLLRQHRQLQIRGVLALLMFASFAIFWSALVLLLTPSPWNLSHGQIGALGLVGAVSALIASRAGRRVDRGLALSNTRFALMILLLSWLPLWLGESSLLLLIIGIFMLDAGGQALHVTSQSVLLSGRNGAGSQLIAAYMLFYSAGSGLGALISTQAFAYGGWSAVCLAGAITSLLALIFGLRTQSHEVKNG
ncbi:MFS transporter [Erwinia sp. JUb26]|uniref:MFS transporter n=1 Tax=Erwinia sp. JUb26 TaxID=2485126 RepID=UPI000F990C7D|nr:MFS transporter [Erwinia sp. JUb26]ROR10050.1 putative MFS family arabinose efflux permease [Erwinia sp. JUb26]